MRSLIFAAALLSAFGFAQFGFVGTASACTNIEHVSTTDAEHVIKPGGCLSSTNGRYVLTMRDDGTLALDDKRHPGLFRTWTANDGNGAVPGSSASLKDDGSFVLADPTGKEVWRAPVHLPAGTAAGYHGDFFMVLENTGRLILYKGIGPWHLDSVTVWTSKVVAVADTNGACQCHITNSDGSPGKSKDASFTLCGVPACHADCAAKKDYFGDALIGTYTGGTGKCAAF